MSALKRILIRDGLVFDPAQGIRGERGNMYVAEGKIAEPFNDPDIIIEACQRPVLAGGIDPYCHLASPGQVLSRMTSAFPSPREIGSTYARMGYVHVHQPFMTLLTAGSVRHALARIPFIDSSARAVIDLRDMGKSVRGNNYLEFGAMARALIDLTGSLGLLLAFPYLKHRQRHYIQKNISAKKMFEFFSHLDDAGILPISLWGMPDLFDNEIPCPRSLHVAGLGTALGTEASLEKAAHFLDAGGSADLGLGSGGLQLAVLGDAHVTPGCVSIDVGINTPLRYDSDHTPLESRPLMSGWSLLGRLQEGWRLALSAAGPSGGQPGLLSRVAAWLLERGDRPLEVDKALDGRVFDLYDLARLTRLEPARSLGLDTIGHLGIGANANVAIYSMKQGNSSDGLATGMAECWCLVKDGILVRDKGEFTGMMPPARMYRRRVESDINALVRTDLLQNPTVRWEHVCRTDMV